MRGVKVLAVCCAVLGAQGAAAQDGAQDGTQDTESRLAARWSVGAGLGYNGFVVLGGSLGFPGLGTLGGVSGLAGRTSLEYLMGENLALVLGASGSYAHATFETEGELVPREPQSAYGFTANVGLRGFVASAGATRFSVYGLLNAGASHRDDVASVLREERTRSFYVSAGFGVDHQLLERLSVRVSADLLSVGYSSLRQTLASPTGGPETESRAGITSATLYLAPSLELRLAF